MQQSSVTADKASLTILLIGLHKMEEILYKEDMLTPTMATDIIQLRRDIAGEFPEIFIASVEACAQASIQAARIYLDRLRNQRKDYP